MGTTEDIREIRKLMAEIEPVESRKRAASGASGTNSGEPEWRASFGLPATPADSRTGKASSAGEANRGGGWTGVFGFDGER
jgi:hypothetical protein